MGRSSARGGRGKGRNSVHTTSPPPSNGGSAPALVTTPAIGVTPTVFVPSGVPPLPATPATLSARGGKRKGLSSVHIHIEEHTTSPPSIGFAAPAPVCTPATLVGFTTSSTPAHVLLYVALGYLICVALGYLLCVALGYLAPCSARVPYSSATVP
ncbi:hypothetical protein Droror1_Dr00008573 [Drosera rotundifolia]